MNIHVGLAIWFLVKAETNAEVALISRPRDQCAVSVDIPSDVDVREFETYVGACVDRISDRTIRVENMGDNLWIENPFDK